MEEIFHLRLHLNLPFKPSDLAISDPQKDMHTQLSACNLQARHLSSLPCLCGHSPLPASNYDAPKRSSMQNSCHSYYSSLMLALQWLPGLVLTLLWTWSSGLRKYWHLLMTPRAQNQGWRWEAPLQIKVMHTA